MHNGAYHDEHGTVGKPTAVVIGAASGISWAMKLVLVERCESRHACTCGTRRIVAAAQATPKWYMYRNEQWVISEGHRSSPDQASRQEPCAFPDDDESWSLPHVCDAERQRPCTKRRAPSMVSVTQFL